MNNKRGFIVSTSKNLYCFICRKNGEVQMKHLKFNRPHSGMEFEIQGHSSIFFKGFLYVSFIYRVRRSEEESISGIFYVKLRGPYPFTTDTFSSIDVEYVPYKISYRQVDDQLFLLVSHMAGINCNDYSVYNAENLEKILSNNLAVESFLFHRAAPVAVASTWHINQYLFAIGCQNGDISLIIYKTDPIKYKNTFKISIDGPISSLLLLEIESEIADLLAVSAVGYCILFRDVLQNGFDKKILLKPKTQDALTCAVASDVDFDGQKEIIIGSYSKEIICFKVVGGIAEEIWKIELVHPVFCICDVDVNKDGVNELVVVSMFGVHIYVPDHRMALLKLQAVKRYLESSDIN